MHAEPSISPVEEKFVPFADIRAEAGYQVVRHLSHSRSWLVASPA